MTGKTPNEKIERERERERSLAEARSLGRSVARGNNARTTMLGYVVFGFLFHCYGCVALLVATFRGVRSRLRRRQHEREHRQSAAQLENVVRARKHLYALSCNAETRVCPVCMDNDAMDERGVLHGVACPAGHPYCARCAAKLVRLHQNDETAVIWFECPLCRRPAWLNAPAAFELIKQLTHDTSATSSTSTTRPSSFTTMRTSSLPLTT